MIKDGFAGMLFVLLILAIALNFELLDSTTIPKDVRGVSDSNVKIQWNQTYGGTGWDVAHSVLQTADGGFVLAGTTGSFGAGYCDMWLVKTDAQGVTQWDQTYGGIGMDEAWSVLQTTDDGFVLVGTTGSYGTGYCDMWLVKTDAQGVMQWDQTYGGPGHDGARSVIQTADDGFVLAGFTDSYGAGDCDMWLVKTDNQGVMQWDQTYGGTGPDEAYSVLQTADGGIVLVGTTGSYGAGSADMWLVKTDNQGVMQWDQTYGGIGSDGVFSVLQTADGGFVLVGATGSYEVGSTDMWLVKTNNQGVTQWDQTYGGIGSDEAWSVLQTADGGFVLAGTTESYGAGYWDMWLVKTDAQGVAQWNQTYGGTGWDAAYSIFQTSDGGFVLAGYTMSYWTGESDMWLVKIRLKGSYGTPGLDSLTLLAAILVLNIWYKRRK